MGGGTGRFLSRLEKLFISEADGMFTGQIRDKYICMARSRLTSGPCKRPVPLSLFVAQANIWIFHLSTFTPNTYIILFSWLPNVILLPFRFSCIILRKDCHNNYTYRVLLGMEVLIHFKQTTTTCTMPCTCSLHGCYMYLLLVLRTN